MPIRFRCVYCEQLLGIARRKAGTVVKCPNCAGQLIVPAPEAADAEEREQTASVTANEMAGARKSAPAKAGHGGVEAVAEGGLLFERSDFDELLRPVADPGQPVSAGKRLAPRVDEPAPIDLAELAAADRPALPQSGPSIISPSARPQSGILLTPLRATLLCIAGVVLTAAAFGAGVFLGMILARPAQ